MAFFHMQSTKILYILNYGDMPMEDFNKKTKIFKIENLEKDKAMIEEAANIIKSGGTVVFPTETVYGLGGNALDEEGARKIYKAKGRPSDNPLIVHISDPHELYKVAAFVSENSKKLMDAFWPGPLTIIFKKTKEVPYATTGNLETVAVRMPSNEIARKLIEMSGVPIAAPSANISGRPSITSAEYIEDEFTKRVDAIIIHSDSEIGLESTVIDMTSEKPIILRPGKIGKKDIEKVLGFEIEEDSSLKDKNTPPKSPGMKYTHYSPNAEIVVVKGSETEIVNKIKREIELAKNGKIGVICLEKYLGYYDGLGISLGENHIEAAKNFFKILRKVDDIGLSKVYIHFLEGDSVADAVMNRLIKAAGNHII